MEDYLEHIDLYEVDKSDYRSYEYRCKERVIMKITPQSGLTVFRDTKTGEWLYGYDEETIMGMPARRYYIFYFLPEEELGPHLTYREVHLTDEDYLKFCDALTGGKYGKEN